jgi:hypothetical protein
VELMAVLFVLGFQHLRTDLSEVGAVLLMSHDKSRARRMSTVHVSIIVK